MTSASVFFLSVMHAMHDSFRKMRSFVFIERISEVTDVFHKERDFKAVSEAIGKDAGVADISGYTDYGRVWREFREQVEDELHPRATVIVLGDARTNGRDAAADVFAADRRQGRPHLLAEPRAAPLLELRRQRHRRLRAALRGLRVLDRRAPRGLRQGADRAGRGAAVGRVVQPQRAVTVWRDPGVVGWNSSIGPPEGSSSRILLVCLASCMMSLRERQAGPRAADRLFGSDVLDDEAGLRFQAARRRHAARSGHRSCSGELVAAAEEAAGRIRRATDIGKRRAAALERHREAGVAR